MKSVFNCFVPWKTRSQQNGGDKSLIK